MALQNHLDGIPEKTSGRELAAKWGLNKLNSRWDPSLVRAARADSAYFIDDSLTAESSIYPCQRFGEVILKGHVPRISCVEVAGRLTLALPFFDAIVLGPTQNIETELVDYELDGFDTVLPLDVIIRRPLYTPVEDLRFITLAA